jgi:Peptidase family M13
MSSPARGGYQGPSTPSEPSPKQPKRPTSLGRHTSSWVNRLHRHHDRKHHPSDDDVERPLLANDPTNEEDEPSQQQAASPSAQPNRLHRFLTFAHEHGKAAFTSSHNMLVRNVLVRNTKYILIACLLALLTLLLSLVIAFFFHHKEHQTRSTCESAECVHAASEILYNLDPDHAKLDACTQFDKMVCGGWEQRHDLRPDQGDMFTGTIMAENSKTILRHILEQTSSSSLSSSADQEIFRKLKDDYDSCMNEKELQDVGLKPLEALIEEIKTTFTIAVNPKGQSTFPKLGTTTQRVVGSDESNQLTNILTLLTKLDISALLDCHVEVNTYPSWMSADLDSLLTTEHVG